MRRVLLAIVLMLIPAPAAAWWEYGHETVAKIAWSAVRPVTRARMRVLLRHSAGLATPQCPARTIAEASVWPDCIKPLKDAAGKSRFGYAYDWHFQDVDICKPFALPAECAQGNCVSAQIVRQQRLLADRRAKPVDRLRALAFLVHLVGDLHQPLHAGSRGDQGGNQVAARYGIVSGRRVNLHAIWDGWLAERAISTPPGGARGLSAEARRSMAAGSVLDWSRESARLSRDKVYASAFGGDPCGPAGSAVLDDRAIEALIPVVRLQVERGGMRLARLLDEALRGG